MAKNDVFWDENGGNFDDIELTHIELGLLLVYVGVQRVPTLLWIIYNHFGSLKFYLWVCKKVKNSHILRRHQKSGKINVAIWEIGYYTFVGNVYAVLGLSWFSYQTSFDAFSVIFRLKKWPFFSKNDFFDFSINQPIWPIFMKKS